MYRKIGIRFEITIPKVELTDLAIEASILYTSPLLYILYPNTLYALLSKLQKQHYFVVVNIENFHNVLSLSLSFIIYIKRKIDLLKAI